MQFGEVDGPWHSAVWMYLPQNPKSKSNYRFTTSNTRAPGWASLAAFSQTVSVCARAARPAAWLPLNSQLAVPDRPKYSCVIVARSLLDAANLSKSIVDAWEGVLMANDSQLVCLAEVNHRSSTQQGVVAALACYPPSTSTAFLARANSQLLEAVLGVDEAAKLLE